jgi:hypothetical protein
VCDDKKPITFGEVNDLCDTECPFFEINKDSDVWALDARCAKLDVKLDFYDWFLAECNNENE